MQPAEQEARASPQQHTDLLKEDMMTDGEEQNTHLTRKDYLILTYANKTILPHSFIWCNLSILNNCKRLFVYLNCLMMVYIA